MSRRGQQDRGKERFWRRVVGQWRRSGLTIRDFCEQQSLSEPSFYAWRRTIAERDREASSGRRRRVRDQPVASPLFVPLRVTPSASVLEIVLGQGRVIRVPPGFDPATLRLLLAVLDEEQRPC